jgi:hypothetical protein
MCAISHRRRHGCREFDGETSEDPTGVRHSTPKEYRLELAGILEYYIKTNT